MKTAKEHVPEDYGLVVGEGGSPAREIVNPKGETEFVELATGYFEDGSIAACWRN